MILEENINTFNEPTRQSYVAILLILYKVYTRVLKQFWYLLVPLFIGKRTDSKYIIYILVGLAILLGIYSIIDFFRYKFHIEGTDLIVNKGVFSKKRIVIPFDRIQSINFKQNLIQQIFGVVGLEIDTAGTSKKEFDFHALNIKTSNSLRDYIFANKKLTTNLQKETTETPLNLEVKLKRILSLDLGDLVKIGVTQNHFRSLFVAIFSIYWLLDNVKKAGIDIDKYMNDINEENILHLGIIILLSLALISIIAVIIVSIFRSIFRYYELVLYRIPNGFKLEYGLFNRNEISVMDNKMQVLIWSDNILRKILKLFTLQIKLASSISVKQRKSILLPGIKQRDINKIKNFYFPNNSSHISKFEKSNIYYLWRRIGIITIIFMLFFMLLTLFINLNNEIISEFYDLYIFLGVSYFYYLLTSYLRYKKMEFGINEEVLQINSGIFGNKYSLFTIYKLQGVKLSQTPGQSHRDIASLKVYSSAGNDEIKYIKKEIAEKLRDYILFKIESDKREWM